MPDMWREHVEKGWIEVTIEPYQERSEKLDLDSDEVSIKRDVYDPRTGAKYEGRRPKCHIEDGRLVLDHPVERPCVFLVRPRAGSSEAEPEEDQEGEE